MCDQPKDQLAATNNRIKSAGPHPIWWVIALSLVIIAINGIVGDFGEPEPAIAQSCSQRQRSRHFRFHGPHHAKHLWRVYG